MRRVSGSDGAAALIMAVLTSLIHVSSTSPSHRVEDLQEASEPVVEGGESRGASSVQRTAGAAGAPHPVLHLPAGALGRRP